MARPVRRIARSFDVERRLPRVGHGGRHRRGKPKGAWAAVVSGDRLTREAAGPS